MVRVAPIILWLGLWAGISLFLDLERRLLPDFFDTVQALATLLINKAFLADLSQTLLRVLPGILLSTLIGVPLGLSLTLSPLLRLLLEPLFSFFRGVPVATLFPVAIILFGIGEAARVVLTVYVALPIIVVSTASGALERPENKTRRDYLRMHRVRLAWWHLPICLLWDALPSVLGGLKIGIALSLVVIIVSEMFFVGGSGAGWYIWDQYQSFNLSNMYASILIVGVVSYGLAFLIDLLQTRVTRS